MNTRLGLVILAVRDLPSMVTFYAPLCGGSRAVTTEVYVEFVIAGGMRLGLYERRGFGRNTGEVPVAVPPGTLTATELYFFVDDVAVAYADLLARGARGLSAPAPRPWGDVAAYAADPEGNVVVVAREGEP